MKYRVEVMMEVDVTIDETTFTPEFLGKFEANVAPLISIEDHVCHLGQLAARGFLEDFTEGYGWLSDMGIEAEVLDVTASGLCVDHAS